MTRRSYGVRYTKGSKDQVDEVKAKREAEHTAAGAEGEFKFSTIDAGDVEARALAQHKGFMTFLGELHREQFNDVAYVNTVITDLLDGATPDPDHERLTCAIKMLEAVGVHAKKQQMDKWIDAVLATKASRRVATHHPKPETLMPRACVRACACIAVLYSRSTWQWVCSTHPCIAPCLIRINGCKSGALTLPRTHSLLMA